ncbi:MAG TPA: S9 family peptidase [Pyrinomonadaceae bacterium]|jgi:oligopeptidase B|nr:S9 family peptidase [Pyrinomonadaceae bacterium]
MKKRKTPAARLLMVLSIMAALPVISLAQFNSAANAPQPPMTEKKSKTTKIHDDTMVDDYFWLREKSNPEVIAHLEAENAYADAMMKPTTDLQDKLYKEMVGHIKETDRSVPYRWGGYYYYTRTEQGKQYPIYCRMKGSLDAKEEVVLDQNEMAKGLKFFSIGAFVPSDDGDLLAFSTDNTGYRQYKLQIKDLRTGQILPESFERVGNVAWATDNKTLFFTTEDAVTKRSDKFFRHVLGSETTDLIFEEKDELFDIGAGRSRDKAVIMLGSESKTSTEWRYLPANKPTAELTIISPREADHEYNVDHRGDLFYIRTNKGAKNFRVVTAPVANPGQANWKELVAYRPEVKIDDLDLFANHLVLSEWEKGLERIEIYDFNTKKLHRVEFPEPVYSASVSQNREFDTAVVRYNYQSLVTPSSVFDYDMNTRKATLLKEVEVPGGFDKKNYKSERLFATAADGTKIPLSVVYRKDTKLDGSAPLLLYGYGSYGYSIPPTFSSNRLSLLDRGVVFVIAHIRGGGELGEEWREAGRMMKKMNTFTDFIDSAEYLVKGKYTSKDRLVIQGGSAGGLLMGAVTNMRPDLFKAVVAQVPFVDVLNTMLDASLPLTTSEYIEWGNPNEKAAYDYMKQYSPYDNVGRKNYPSMLVKVSLNDSQVPYWEGAKLVARIRDMRTDNNPLLLKVNMGAGHGGSSGRYDYLHEVAYDYSYMLWQMGVKG